MQKDATPERGDMLTDIVVGMSDGFIVPLAVTAGLAGAMVQPKTIIMAGAASIVIGAIAMGIGSYYAGKGEHTHGEEEVHDMGFSEDARKTIAGGLDKDKQQLHELAAVHDLSLRDKAVAKRSALNVSLFYLLGGVIPVLPYCFPLTLRSGLLISWLVTMVFLFGFGYFKAAITGQEKWLGALRMVVMGGVAAIAAFFIGGIFR